MKRIAGIGLLVLLICLAGMVLAAGTPTLHIHDVVLYNGGNLDAVVYTNVKDNLGTNDFTVKIDNMDVPVNTVQSYSRVTNYGTSYLLVIDTPSSMTTAGLNVMKEALSAFVSGLGPEDNVGMLRTGTSPSAGTFTDSKSVVADRIKEITKQNKPDTLNATIIEAIAFLETSTRAHTRKVLIVASTGESRSEVGATQAELDDKIKESNVTIYTLAMLERDPSRSRRSQADAFGAMARGRFGIDIIAEDSRIKATDIIKMITDNERQVYILSLAAGEMAGGKPLSISVQEDGRMLSDRAIIPSSPNVVIPSPDGPTSPPTDPPPPTPPPTPKPFPYWLEDLTADIWMLIGASAVLVILLVVLLVVTQKKKGAGSVSETHIVEEADIHDNMRETEVISDAVGGSRIYVTFTPIGNSTMDATSFYLANNLVIGRNPTTAQLVIKDDSKVSGKHAMLTFSGNVMRIEDLRSTNGTRVNDRDVTAPTILQENDIITVGRTSLRIHWRER